MTEQTYTAEQMLAAIPCLVARDMHMEAAMLRQAAQMMRERQPVKVTDEDVDKALTVYSLERLGTRDTDEGAAAVAMRAALESFATRPAAVPDGWKPTAENVNALPGPVRRYIMELETNADPAGMVRENILVREENAMLRAMLDAAMAKE